MADITKCKGTDCPLKDSCYRYLAPSGFAQHWFVDVPYHFKDKHECTKYIDAPILGVKGWPRGLPKESEDIHE